MQNTPVSCSAVIKSIRTVYPCRSKGTEAVQGASIDENPEIPSGISRCKSLQAAVRAS